MIFESHFPASFSPFLVCITKNIYIYIESIGTILPGKNCEAERQSRDSIMRKRFDRLPFGSRFSGFVLILCSIPSVCAIVDDNLLFFHRIKISLATFQRHVAFDIEKVSRISHSFSSHHSPTLFVCVCFQIDI